MSINRKSNLLRLTLVAVTIATSAAHADPKPLRVRLDLAVREALPLGTPVSFYPGIEKKQLVAPPGAKKGMAALSASLSPIGLAAVRRGNKVEIVPAMLVHQIAASLPPEQSSHIFKTPGFEFTAPIKTVPVVVAERQAPHIAVASNGGPVSLVGALSNSKVSAPASTTPAPHPVVRTVTTKTVTVTSSAPVKAAVLDHYVPTVPLPPAAHLAKPLSMPVVAEVPAISPPPPPPPTWTVSAGMTLQSAVDSWAARAGYKVIYQTPDTFPIQAGATYTGSFLHALRDLAYGFQGTTVPLIHPYTGNRHIVITSSDH